MTKRLFFLLDKEKGQARIYVPVSSSDSVDETKPPPWPICVII